MDATTRLHADIEIREAERDDSPGRITGTVLKYGTRGEKGRETFAPGSLTWPESGIRVDVEHLSSPVKGSVAMPVAVAVPFVEGDEVRIDAELENTEQARALASFMRKGLYRRMSIEFRHARTRWTRGVREVVQAVLVGAALTDTPSYADTSASIRTEGRRRKAWL